MRHTIINVTRKDNLVTIDLKGSQYITNVIEIESLLKLCSCPDLDTDCFINAIRFSNEDNEIKFRNDNRIVWYLASDTKTYLRDIQNKLNSIL